MKTQKKYGGLLLEYKKLAAGGFTAKRYALGGSVPIDQEDWMGKKQDWSGVPYSYKDDGGYDSMAREQKEYSGSNRTAIGNGVAAAGEIARGFDNTRFGDFRDDTDNISEGAMNVVGKFGTVGAVIGGAYNVINTVGKKVRYNSEATDAWGQMKTPKKAGHMAVIGALLDPISAITTRKKLGYWGGNGQKYAAKLQEKLTEKFQAEQQPFLDSRRLQFDGLAAQDYEENKDKPQAQYYKHGGSLLHNMMANQKATGGSMQPMSKDTTVAVGPSHAQGGIGLPNQGAEVEGGETTSGDYVFSKELGFAKLHRPIAKAMGAIETRPATPERIKSLQLLQQKEEVLKGQQETLKSILNLQ